MTHRKTRGKKKSRVGDKNCVREKCCRGSYYRAGCDNESFVLSGDLRLFIAKGTDALSAKISTVVMTLKVTSDFTEKKERETIMSQ